MVTVPAGARLPLVPFPASAGARGRVMGSWWGTGQEGPGHKTVPGIGHDWKICPTLARQRCGTELCPPAWGIHSQGPGAPSCHQPALQRQAQIPDSPLGIPIAVLPIAVSKMSRFSLNQDSLSLVSLHSFIRTCVGHLLRAGLRVRCAGTERGVLGAAPVPPGYLHSLKRKAAPTASCPKPRWPLFLDRLPGQCVGQVPAPCLVTSDADVTVCWGRREVTSPGPDRKPAQCWEGGAPRLVAQQPPQPAEWESHGTTGSQPHASWADGPHHGLGIAAGPTCSAETPESGFGGRWPWAGSAVLLDACGHRVESGGHRR